MTEKKQSSKSEVHNLSAVSASFLEHQSFLKKFLSRYLYNHQDIEDVAQETYLRAFNFEKKQTINSPKAFLFRIAKNIALNELAKRSRLITDYIDDSVSPDVICEEKSPLQQAEDGEKLAVFTQACHTLPAQCRKAFLLRKVYGLSHKEIAEKMVISVSTVEKHITSGVIRCGQYVRNRGYSLENITALDKEQGKQIKESE